MHIGWEEQSGPWSAASPIEGILTALENNPFSSPQQMDLNRARNWQPYDRDHATRMLLRGRTPSVALITESPHALGLAISRVIDSDIIVMTMDDAYVTSTGPQAVVTFTQQVAEALPRFIWAHADCDPNPGRFSETHHLPRAPLCFNLGIDWYHLISPLGYAPYYTVADLLGVPALQVRQLENGWIEVLSYADPLAYDRPENRQRTVEMTAYLDQHRRDRPGGIQI